MIPNCPGCKEEFNQAFLYMKEGLHLANTIEGIGIDTKKHLFIIMVDDKGKTIVS